MKFHVNDLGLFAELSSKLADGGKNQVTYYSEWASTFPTYNNYCIGKDYKNLNKVLYFNDPFKQYIKNADCIVAFDVHNNDQIALLREQYPEKSIFGAGKGEIIENDRWLLKQMLKEAGLKVQKSDKVIGIPNLIEYLKDHENVWVKTNIFRGDMESFHVNSYEEFMNDTIIQYLISKLGPHAEDYEFIVEENIDSIVESGFDGFFNGEKYVGPFLTGYEVDKELYVARINTNWKDVPAQIRETQEAFIPYLQELDYRGAISTEEKILKDSHYLLDWCSRLFSPGSMLYNLATNWPEFIYSLGRKQDVPLNIPYKYAGAVPIMSEMGKDRYLLVSIDKGFENNIGLRAPYNYNGNLYSVPPHTIVATAYAGGQTIEEVKDKLRKACDAVHFQGKDDAAIETLDKLDKKISEGKKLGIEI